MSTDLDTAARAYAAFFETIAPETVEGLRGLVSGDVHFKDPFNDVHGVDRMIRVFDKMFADVSDVRFELLEQSRTAGVCFIRWRFAFQPRRFAHGHPWRIEGVSAVRFDASGKVIEHIDYWDAAGQIYERLPLLGLLLRRIRGRLGVRD